MLVALLVAFVREARPLEDWILSADRIALGRVERVIELDSGELEATAGRVRIAVVQLERQLVGPAGETLLHVVDPSPIAPQPGARALYFLQRWDTQPAEARDEIEAALGGATVWQTFSNWSVGQDPGETLLPHWLVEARLGERESLRIEPVLTSLEAELTRCLPRIEAQYGYLMGWRLVLGPDRRITENGEFLEVLSTERWDELLQLAERIAFFELPEIVGHWSMPEEAEFVIQLHTRSGKQWVRIFATRPREADDVPAWTKACELWNALPGTSKPKL